MGGNPFLAYTTLTMNGCGVKTRALVDTGANGYLFMNRPLALRLAQSLGLKIQNLPFSVPIRGYNSQIQSKVNQFIRLHLNVDQRRIRNCPFIVLDLGQQDLIIGNKWLKHFRVLLDPVKNKIIWPADTPPTPYLGRDVILSLQSGKGQKPLPNVQSDANRRDRAIEQDQIRRRNGVLLNEMTSPDTPQPNSIPIVEPEPD